MLLLLQHMLWDFPEQKSALRTLIIERVVNGGIDHEKLEKDISSLKKIIDNEIEILDDEKLPVTVYQVNRDGYTTNKSTYHEIYQIYKTDSNAKFSFKSSPYNSSDKFDFKDLLHKLKIEHEFSPREGLSAEKRILYQKEFHSLENKYLHQRKFVKDTYEHMKKDLDVNIWLTPHDVDEVSHIQQQSLNKVYNLEEKMNEIRKNFKI